MSSFLEKELTRILLNIKTIEHVTPLMMVDNAKDSKILIDLGADVNAITKSEEYGYNNFSVLSCAKDAEQAKVILDAGVDIDLQVSNMRNIDLALFYAKDVEHTKVLLDAGANPNIAQDCTHILMHTKDLDQLKVLLEAGANPNWVDPKNNFSVLMYKCYFGPFDLYSMITLLSAGADPKYVNNIGYTILMRLLSSLTNEDDLTELILLLVDAGVDVNHAYFDYKYKTVRTALHLADKPEDVKFLIKLGAKVDINIDGHGCDAFIHSKSLEKSKILLEAGADVNSRTFNGVTALMMAKDLEQVKFLIDNGADVNAKCIDGTTAIKNASPEKRKLLIEAGAKQ